ncbi:unnamed protein product [Polarella glacialis]|uniref:Uncharacterized protein n=1 Tax=Polarella glacialis TaxID=89957 RepID=A0A813DUB4_POLGL|nr:unnamed protein product [Polarella glacialis]
MHLKSLDLLPAQCKPGNQEAASSGLSRPQKHCGLAFADAVDASPVGQRNNLGGALGIDLERRRVFQKRSKVCPPVPKRSRCSAPGKKPLEGFWFPFVFPKRSVERLDIEFGSLQRYPFCLRYNL